MATENAKLQHALHEEATLRTAEMQKTAKQSLVFQTWVEQRFTDILKYASILLFAWRCCLRLSFASCGFSCLLFIVNVFISVVSIATLLAIAFLI